MKLQQKHAELEQKYTHAIAVSGNAGTEHFVSRLLKLVSDLFDKPVYRYVHVHTCDLIHLLPSEMYIQCDCLVQCFCMFIATGTHQLAYCVYGVCVRSCACII